jgi:RNA polymerase sigma-70 factor (ECF subfamily)
MRAAATSVHDPGPPHDTSRPGDLMDLVARAQAGDAEAYGRIYELNVDSVYRFVHSRVGDRHLAEDLTSETFMRGLRRIDSFSWQGRDMVAWFITIARNLILDHAKSARNRLETTTGEMWDADEALAGVDESVIDRDRAQRLMSALAQLKPEQAECLSLRFLHERNLAETAEILGRTEGAVKQLQLRAIRALRELIGDDAELATW